jgi:H+/Cl- antiporter ClcA
MLPRRYAGLAGCSGIIGVAAGFAAAVFLWSLDLVTHLHWQHPWLLYLLPLAGLLSGLAGQHLGGRAEGGTELILDEIRQPKLGVPGRMAPLVLLGTLITHLCGGSSGREGTAVQMGGSLAALLARRLHVPRQHWPLLLACGMAGGFGAVFGTPLAGAVFALEVSAVVRTTAPSSPSSRRLNRTLPSLLLCLLAAVVADGTVELLGVGHTEYRVAGFTAGEGAHQTNSEEFVQPLLFAAKAGLAGTLFGLAAGLFIWLRNSIRTVLKRHVPQGWLRPVMGGLFLILLVKSTGGTSYLGLGVEASPQRPGDISICGCLGDAEVGWLSWFWKLLFTAVTVGSGFKGGEVTPLFFVGAALGNVLGSALSMSPGILAAIGFVAVFAGAARTPLACTLMAIEVFGPANPGVISVGFIFPTVVCCVVAAKFSGHRRIYDASDSDLVRT